MKDSLPNFKFPRSLSRRSLRMNSRALTAAGTLLLSASLLHSQTPLPTIVRPDSKSAALSARSNAEITSIRIVQEKDGPAVEILSTKPLVPSIQALKDPDRLVIDLPNARLATSEKRIVVDADEIKAMRANQFQQNPPVTRVVLDLLAPRTYSWDVSGNRLVVHLGKNPNQESSSPFQPPTVTSVIPARQPVVASVRAAGPLTLAANDGDVGSAITANTETAVVHLSSGGEVDVCPGTTLSLTPSQNRHNLMFSMNAGALEAHLDLDASSDSVLTPDFRILLIGPGEFHYAISADNHGNTCVRALPGNTASAIVTELLGDRTYRVKPTDQLVFRSGQLDRVDMAVPLECGCPPQRDAPLRAATTLPIQPQNAMLPSSNPAGPHVSSDASAAIQGAGARSEAPPANDVHVEITAPFVFHGTDAPPPAVAAANADSHPKSTTDSADPFPTSAHAASKADAPGNAAASAPPRGFFKKLGAFFSRLFR